MSRERVVIDIARDFSKNPYGRYPKDGDYNGTAFREKFLVPKLRGDVNVLVDMGGTNRYGSSFIDEAFGGLIRVEKFKLSELRDKLTIEHRVLPSLAKSAWKYMEQASEETQG